MVNLFELFDAEYKFMDIVWARKHISIAELTRICEKELGWKRSTTYSMIKKLCKRGIIKNEKAIVTMLIAKEGVQKYKADILSYGEIDRSIPSFIISFL